MADWTSAIQGAFPQDLATRITHAASGDQNLESLFYDVAAYVFSLQPQSTIHPTNNKKRKLDNGVSSGVTSTEGLPVTHILEYKDVSVQMPARKKLKISLTHNQDSNATGLLRLINQSTNEVEYIIAPEKLEEVFMMPVPDKQARQAYFAIFPKADAILPDGSPAEPILFTVPETSPPSAASSEEVAISQEDTYLTVTHQAFSKLLAPYRKKVTTPDAAEFASSRPQHSRKGEKAYHVNAHRGSKEGYLYFLPNGILFGFKKPLSFFPFARITSISYTSVLQRTFNLVVAYTEPNNAVDVKEAEFSMLDQEDFVGIDEYVKRHGLNDASMAAERRAKAYNVKVKSEANGDVGAGGDEEDGRTELEKAEQELQDAEDEEEENYEASGGESDGEGEYSEEDEDGDGGEGEEMEDAEEEEE